jgi:hypothetical protein
MSSQKPEWFCPIEPLRRKGKIIAGFFAFCREASIVWNAVFCVPLKWMRNCESEGGK